MTLNLKDGIPVIKDYKEVVESEDFKQLDMFNEAFLLKNAHTLADYSARWVANPLKQWSRQWEYPYVYNKLSSLKRSHLRILDAGSGCTFFPYFLAQNGFDLTCCDSDQSLKTIHEGINDNLSGVKFEIRDLRSLDYEDNSFDAIYCISVLEHTDNYADIIGNFERILKPGGLLAVTFDIHLSIDGVNLANGLIASLIKSFQGKEKLTIDYDALMSNKSLITTNYFKMFNATLLPWKQRKFLFKTKTHFEPLTCMCSSCYK